MCRKKRWRSADDGPAVAEIGRDRPSQRRGQRQRAIPPPLAAPDRHDPAPPVDVVQGQGDDLADAEPQVAHAPDHRQVAAAGRRAVVEMRRGPRGDPRPRATSASGPWAIAGPSGRLPRATGRSHGTGQEAEEAAQRGRQDGDRSGPQMIRRGVGSSPGDRPAAGGRGPGGTVAEVPVQELAGVPQAVEAACARTVRKSAGGTGRTRPGVASCRVGGEQQSSRVLLVEHPQQMVDRRPARDEARAGSEPGTSRSPRCSWRNSAGRGPGDVVGRDDGVAASPASSRNAPTARRNWWTKPAV